MKQFYKLFLIVAIAPTLVLANNGKFKGKHTKEKTIHKEYDVNANAGLEVDNSYGNVDIVTWNQNKVVIDVVIKTNGNNEEKVTQRLNDITVNFGASSSLVTAETKFGNKKNKWNSWWGKGKNNVSVEVNYVIKMPVTNTVNLDNDYGAISLDKLQGNARISCDYGQLIIGELMAENNSLNFDYTNNSTIKYMKSGKINADYSSFTLDRAEELDLNADYTKSEIGEVTNINYNNDYGKIKIGSVGSLVGLGDYINHIIGDVNNSLNINADYGSIKIGKITATCKDVTIRSEYTSISIGVASGYTAKFIANLNYAGLKGKDVVEITKSHEKHSDKLYEGYFGSKESSNTMNINSNYGGVSLKRQ